MTTTTFLRDETPTVAARIVAIERLKWVGPLTVLTSVVGVHAVRMVAVALISVPGGPIRTSLGWIAPTADTVILCTLAVLVFIMVAGFSDDPLRSYQRVAFGALLVSFLPLLNIARGAMSGNRATAAALLAMHVAAYLPCVTLLPRLSTLTPDSMPNEEVRS